MHSGIFNYFYEPSIDVWDLFFRFPGLFSQVKSQNELKACYRNGILKNINGLRLYR